FLLGLMSDYLFGRRAEPVWSYDVKQELESSRWSDAQKTLLRDVVAKYDQDKSGALDISERNNISSEDKGRLARAGMGGSWWASVLYTVTPNWQLFWLADALEEDVKIPYAYLGRAFGYVAAYVGAALALALVLFEDRELN